MTAGRKSHRTKARLTTGDLKVKEPGPRQRQLPKVVEGHDPMTREPVRNDEGFTIAYRCGWRSPMGERAKQVRRSYREHLFEVAAVDVGPAIQELGPIESDGRRRPSP